MVLTFGIIVLISGLGVYIGLTLAGNGAAFILGIVFCIAASTAYIGGLMISLKKQIAQAIETIAETKEDGHD